MTTPIIKIIVDTSSAEANINRLNRSLNSVGSTGKGATSGLSGLSSGLTGSSGAAKRLADSLKGANDNAESASRGFKRTGSAAESAKASLESTRTGVDKLRAALGALGLAATAAGVIKVADSYTEFTNALKVAGVEGVNSTIVQNGLLASAQKYGVELNALGKLYSRAAQAGKSLGASQKDLLAFTNAVSAALKIQGGSVESASGSLLQLSQLLQSGTVHAEEYNSVNEGAFPILQAVAAGSDKYAGSVAKLRAAVIAGTVTSRDFFAAFLKGSSSLEDRAAKSVLTTAQGFTRLENAIEVYIGRSNQLIGVTTTIGAALGGLANNLNTVVPIVATVGLALGVGFVANAIRAQVAAVGVAGAARTMGASLFAAFGGGLGLSITAIAVAIGYFANSAASANAAVNQANTAFDQMKARLASANITTKDAGKNLAGVGTDALGAIPHITAFGGQVGTAAQKLYDLARASRAARLEMLQSQLVEAQKNEVDLGSRTRSGRRNAPMTRGDFLNNAGVFADNLVGDARSLLSGGRTDRELDAAYGKSVTVSTDLQKQIADLKSGKVTDDDIPQFDDPKKKPKKDRVAERTKEFWQSLQNAVATARLLPPEAEKLTKQQELQKIQQKDIGDLARARINLLVQEAAAAKAITGVRETTRQTEIEIALNKQRGVGLTDAQKSVEDVLMERRRDALVAGVTMNNILGDAYQLEEKRLKTSLEQLETQKALNAAIKDNNEIAAKYSTIQDRSNRIEALNKDRKSLLLGDGQGDKVSDPARKQAIANIDLTIAKINNEFKDQFTASIDQLAQSFGGKLGKALSSIASGLQSMSDTKAGVFGGGVIGGIASLFAKNLSDGSLTKFGSGYADGANGTRTAIADLANGKGVGTSIKEGFSDFKSIFSTENGGFQKGLGKLLGKFGAGAQIGDTVSKLAGAVGIKLNNTGSQIGGALGSAFGPIGSIVGSIGGGLLGNLFAKKKTGSAGIEVGSDGFLTASASTGNSGKLKAAAHDLAGSVASGLQQIAEQFGGKVDGSSSLKIGKYKDDIRVNPSGGGLKVAQGGVDFADDAEGAVQYAIRTALSQGIISGLDGFTQLAINKIGDIDNAIATAMQFKNVQKSIKQFENPLAAAVDAINDPLKSLRATMLDIGATSEDLAKLDRLRSLQLDDLKKKETSAYTDLQKVLNGETQGTVDRYNTDLSSFGSFESDLKSGKTVDQGDFTSLVQKLLTEGQDIFGTSTSQYTDLVNRLTAANTLAITNTTSAIDTATTAADATTVAIQNQTQQLVTQGALTNDYLSQLVALAKGNAAQAASNPLLAYLGNVNGIQLGVF